MDITTNDHDGSPWDFDDPKTRGKARMRVVVRDQPFVLVASPMCSAFSQLQSINFAKMTEEKVRELIRRGLVHLLFAMELCQVQVDAGRYYMFEHPWTARSWQIPAVQRLAQRLGTHLVRTDMCCYDMSLEGWRSHGLVKKPTGIMTNSAEIARMVARRCDDSHDHLKTMMGNIKQCRIYPSKFCQAVCEGIRRQRHRDEQLQQAQVVCACQDPETNRGQALLDMLGCIMNLDSEKHHSIHEDDPAEAWQAGDTGDRS